jgi:hypothetical protein
VYVPEEGIDGLILRVMRVWVSPVPLYSQQYATYEQLKKRFLDHLSRLITNLPYLSHILTALMLDNRMVVASWLVTALLHVLMLPLARIKLAPTNNHAERPLDHSHRQHRRAFN